MMKKKHTHRAKIHTVPPRFPLCQENTTLSCPTSPRGGAAAPLCFQTCRTPAHTFTHNSTHTHTRIQSNLHGTLFPIPHNCAISPTSGCCGSEGWEGVGARRPDRTRSCFALCPSAFPHRKFDSIPNLLRHSENACSSDFNTLAHTLAHTHTHTPHTPYVHTHAHGTRRAAADERKNDGDTMTEESRSYCTAHTCDRFFRPRAQSFTPKSYTDRWGTVRATNGAASCTVSG